MKKLTDIYHIYFRSKLFNQIILIFSIVTILTFCTLAVLVYHYSRSTLLQKERDAETQAVSGIGRYLEQQQDESSDIVFSLYQNQPVLSDMLYCLQYDFPAYIQNRLNDYLARNSTEDRNIETFIRNQMKQKSDILQIALYSRRQSFLFVFNRNNTQGIRWIDPKDRDKVLQAVAQMRATKKASSRTPSLDQALGLGSGDYTFAFELNNPDTLQNEGVLLVSYDTDGIRQSLDLSRKPPMGYQLVLYPDGQVLYDSSRRYEGQVYPRYEALAASQGYAKLQTNVYTSNLEAEKPGLLVSAIVPAAEMESLYSGLKFKVMSLTAIGMLIMISLAYIAVYRHARRTRAIVSAMKQAQQGNLTIRVPTGRKDELDDISVTFNQMCEELSTYINQVYVSEVKQKRAELVALQAQINPHFLYNTLEAIRMRAMIQGAADVGEMTYVLGSLFRYSVRPETTVKLEDEVDYCRQFLELHRIRYRDKMAYLIEIDEEVRKTPVFKLSLQPLVENAIVHGVKLSAGGSKITIRAFPEPDSAAVQVEIEDNGEGLSPDKLLSVRMSLDKRNRTETSSSMGLRNVNERIRLMHGDAYGLEIESRPETGTLVRLRLPFDKEVS